VGSDLKSDDAAGLRVAERLARLNLPGVHALVCGTAPENAAGEIRRLGPSDLVIVDSADLGEAPGTARLVPLEKVGGVSFSTHALPIRVLSDYLRAEVGCRVTILGIQPRSLRFGETLSPEVERAVEGVVLALAEVLQERIR
jgi:hydrogenase 3 maturation protease